MRELEGGASGRRVRRIRGAAWIIVSGLVVFAPAAFSFAENAPDNVPQTQGADNTAPAATPASGTSDKTAAIRDAISRMIASYENDIRGAYHRELKNNPRIEGEITVSFTVKPDGEVADVTVEKSTLNWRPLEEELLNKVRAWKFTPFEGEPVPASVPYKFNPN